MAEDTSPPTPEASGTLKLGSWLGAGVSAAGLGACLALVTLGGTRIMDEGGFVAQGGPYEIAHPIPEGMWIMPVAFIGAFVFPLVHGIFASRIKGFGLAYWTWCAAWTTIGGTTLWYGIDPPRGGGLVWGWLIMGSVFLLVGLGSTWLYVSYLLTPAVRNSSEMPKKQRVPYAVMILAALAAGVVAGFQVYGAVVG